MAPERLVIVGNDGGTNVGASLHRAAQSLGLSSTMINAYQAYAAPLPVAKLNWWLRGRRPSRLGAFSREVVRLCDELRPRWLLATGIAPVDREALTAISRLGVETTNYLTDDPWNPDTQRAWFLSALNAYDRICSVRLSNLDDLRAHGCRRVEYMPFGVDPELFFPEAVTPDEAVTLRSDVFFAGGADRDRVRYLGALIEAKLHVGLYGDYWDRFTRTRGHSRGHAPPSVLRKAIASASISLGLVRRSNRDGHSMRSFEVPAVGACMLFERTDEHLHFFGPPGDNVMYFSTISEMIERARELLADAGLRRRLAQAVRRVIDTGRFTYRDRLVSILGLAGARVGALGAANL